VAGVAEKEAAAPSGAVASSASPAIHTVELTKRFGSTVALAGLSMTVPRGEIFGFLGPNGAGKTTAVKLLLGLLAPTAGEAWVLGEPAGNLGTRRRIGYLPELFRYQSWLSAREVLAMHCELAPLPRATWKEEIDRTLAIVGLAERGGDRVGTFSKACSRGSALASLCWANQTSCFSMNQRRRSTPWEGTTSAASSASSRHAAPRCSSTRIF